MEAMTMKSLAIMMSVIITIWLIGIYFIIQEDTKCDSVVTLTDGETYECTAVASFSSGMSSIRLCDGTNIDVPTIRIKMVIKK